MIFISASLLNDYLVCKKRAHYRTHNSDQAESTSSMAVGIVVHEVIEKCWNNEVDAIKLGHKLIREYNIVEHSDKVFAQINAYFRMYGTDFFSADDEIEVFFKLPYKDDLTWVGKIDRIHNNSIYDWKTSKKPPKNLNKDLQFILYYLAYEKMKGTPPEKVIYSSLTFQKEYQFEPNTEIINKFLDETMPEIVEGLRNNVQDRDGLDKYRVCDYCAFMRFCFSEMEIGR